ncbi:MAG: ribonuclease III [Butyricicoccus sp.]|nr:ribonuclease III [Butyricicoccus sp.]
MQELQIKLNYEFKDPSLIRTALTHSSYANEHRCQSNERLEFLGDSILGMVVAAYLYRLYPDMPEGRMTRLRAELVCEQSLHRVAARLGFGENLRLGKGEELSGGRERASILADCVEAVIAALYLDGGFDVARAFIMEHILSSLEQPDFAHGSDYKTELQELVQQKPNQRLNYAMVAESGPDHRKTFTAEVRLNGAVLGSGEGRTKKEAEQNAACVALRALRRK